MKKKKRLNPVYWALQFLGGVFALVSLFLVPYIVEKILGG